MCACLKRDLRVIDHPALAEAVQSRLHWHCHFMQKLEDEPGIHWSQLQMQSGTTGINTLRIHNPTKQAVEQDPRGAFIRRWMPELAGVPSAYLHAPWTKPAARRTRPNRSKSCLFSTSTRAAATDGTTRGRARLAKVSLPGLCSPTVLGWRRQESLRGPAYVAHGRFGSAPFLSSRRHERQASATFLITLKQVKR